jgi:hypothetical protein
MQSMQAFILYCIVSNERLLLSMQPVQLWNLSRAQELRISELTHTPPIIFGTNF